MIIEKIDFISGTSYQGEIDTNYSRLVEVFGEPSYGPNEPGKVTCEWGLEIDGVLCTIYDWKEYDETPMGDYEWHIGGDSQEAVRKVYEALNSLQ
jgi:hypothetical protein